MYAPMAEQMKWIHDTDRGNLKSSFCKKKSVQICISSADHHKNSQIWQGSSQPFSPTNVGGNDWEKN